MYIEDLIITLSKSFISNFWDNNLIHSFRQQIADGNYLTNKQRTLAVDILKKYKASLDNSLKQNVDTYIQKPNFKYPIRVINNIPYASIVNYDKWGPSIKLEFPYNQEQIDMIRKSKDRVDLAIFDKELRAWIFALSETSLRLIKNIFENLTYDDEISKYLKDIDKILADDEKYVPMLVIEDNIPKLKNVSPYVPPLESREILPAIFEAGKKGINVWDDRVDNYVNSSELNNIVKNFLKRQNNETFTLNGDIEDIKNISPIVKNLLPCLIILPTGHELNNLKIIHKFLIEENYSSDEISVMFRLDSERNKDFNIFVKDNNLNNPLTNKTKFVVVSSQIPKTVYKKNIQFNLILNFGYVNAHYTIRSTIKNCQNVIVLDYANFFKQTFLKFNSENI